MFPFSLASLGGFLLRNIHIIAIVAALGWLGWDKFVTVPRMQAKLDKVQIELATEQATRLQMQLNIAAYQANMERVNTQLSTMSSLRDSQTRARGRINEPTVATNDRPFADPGMLERARRLREYQAGSPAVAAPVR